MKNLTNESRYLLYVIRSAVKQQKIDPPSEALDWDEFFALSKKNEIFSLVTTALPTEYLPREISQFHKKRNGAHNCDEQRAFNC